MNEEQLKYKYMLVSSDTYKKIRSEALDYIVGLSSSSAISPERIQGMLSIFGVIDSWVTDYERELLKRKEKLNG